MWSAEIFQKGKAWKCRILSCHCSWMLEGYCFVVTTTWPWKRRLTTLWKSYHLWQCLVDHFEWILIVIVRLLTITNEGNSAFSASWRVCWWWWWCDDVMTYHLADSYEVTEEACDDDLFISSAEECEAAANALGIKWNSCCQNNNNLPYGCLKRSDNDIIWNGKADTPNQFPCTVAGNCDHGMRWAVCKTSWPSFSLFYLYQHLGISSCTAKMSSNRFSSPIAQKLLTT